MFSATVMCGNRASLWNTMLVGRFAAGTPAMSLPAMAICPGRFLEAGDLLEQGRLAAARGADKGDELALRRR